MTAEGARERATTVQLTRFTEFAAQATMPAPRGPIDDLAQGDGPGDRAASRQLPEALVAAAICGDRGARQELLGLIHPLVLRYCRARMRRELGACSADDVAQ